MIDHAGGNLEISCSVFRKRAFSAGASSPRESVSQLIFRPAGAHSFSTDHRRLAPWAVFCRRFAAIEFPKAGL